MKQVRKYKFKALVKGNEVEIVGNGTNQFEADRNATINAIREHQVKFNDVQILEVISTEETDEWI